MEHGICTAKEPGTQVVLYIYMNVPVDRKVTRNFG